MSDFITVAELRIEAERLCDENERLEAENAKLRELVRGLHMAHVGMVERYRSSEEGLIWEYSGSIDEDVMKLRQECDEERHRFDAAMRELGVDD